MHIYPLVFMTILASSAAQAAGPIWHEFDLAVSDALGFGEERVALLLRAKVNGQDCRVQLDTGANSEIMWHHPHAPAAARPVPVAIEIGEVKREIRVDASQLAALGSPQCGGVLATVGNAFFDHGTLTLDLGRQRFSFATGTTLSGHPAAQPMLYLRDGGQGGHPLVEIALGNGRRGHVLLDTGAARFGLVATSATQWAELSGGLPLRATSTVRTFNINNAKDSEASACYDTLVADQMTVGGQQLAQTMVSYCRGRDFQLSKPLIGVLGLRPFGDRRLVIDYVAQRWLLGQ